jgi:TolA-binding protein
MVMWIISHIISVGVLVGLLLVVGFLVIQLTPLDEFYRARACAKVGDYKRAEEWYRKGLKAFPNSRYAPQARYELGQLLIEQKRYADALTQLKLSLDGLKDETTKVKALIAIGDCYANMKDWKKASDSYLLAAKRCSFDENLSATALYRAGECFEKAGMNGDAGNAYRKVFEQHPTAQDAPKALLAYAKLLSKLNKVDKALEHYKLLIKRYPNSDEALVARLHMAKLYEEKRDYKEAISLLVEFLKHSPRLVHSTMYRHLLESAKARLKQLREVKAQSAP